VSNITDYILSKTHRLRKSPEVTPGDHGFEMFNDAGTEVEVSEWLYGMIRVIKPDLVLETGTHVGVSAAYISQALEDNKRGKMQTFEIIPEHWKNAQDMLKDLELQHRCECNLISALKYQPEGLSYDVLFLDSEPQLRFNEFVKYWPNLRDGGYIIIHDLNDQLGHNDLTQHGMYDWPWGDWREKLGPFVERGDVNVISFDNPRGLTMFQKTKPTASYYRYGK
jgi:predicted O-methyltransferase YrrM